MSSAACCLRAARPSRLLQALLWLTFLGLAAFEWAQFRSEPTLTMMELEPAQLPAFTVCPGLQSNRSMTGKTRSQGHPLWALVDETVYRNVSYRQVYVEHSLPIGKMLGQKARPGNSSRSDGDLVHQSPKGSWFRTFVASGTCYTYRPRGRQDNKVAYFLGPTLRFYGYPEFTHYMLNTTYSIRFHGSETPFKDYRFFTHKDIPRVALQNEENVQINVKINRYRNPNLRRKPCNNTHGYSKSKCLSECLYRKEAKKLGCVMPWMEVNGTGCIFHSRSDGRAYIRPSAGFPDSCRCLPACLDDRIDIMVGKSTLLKRKGRVYVTIKFEYLSETRITTLAYSGRSLMANVGGHIGLLLGTSILSLLLSGSAALGELCLSAWKHPGDWSPADVAPRTGQVHPEHSQLQAAG